MKLTVLGSSGTFPSASNPASSYLVRTEDVTIWCDAGPGGFQALAALIDPSTVDAILISHSHPDHCVDLFAAFHALTYGREPTSDVPLFAHRSVIERALGFLEADEDHAIHRTFDIHPIESGSVWSIGDVQVEAIAMDHSVPTLGFRFEAHGRRLFYTADTGPKGTWIGRVGSVDLLLAEASLQDGDKSYGQHLTAAEAGKIASDIEATRLLLTHIPPHLDPLVSVQEAEITFGRTVMVAVPGMSHEV